MSRQASSAAIGLFVLAALGLGIGALVLLGGGRVFHKSQMAVIYFRGSVSGLLAGAPVKFKGVDVGQVRDIYVILNNANTAAPDVRIPVVLSLDPSKIGRTGPGGMPEELPPIEHFVDGGLRAQLATTSFVTNLCYVALDVFPGAPKDMINDTRVPYPEIPTIPNALESAEAQAGELLAKVARSDIEGTVRSAKAALDGVERLVTSREIDETLRSVQRGAAAFEATMHNVDALSMSLRRLADRVGPDVVAVGQNARRATETIVQVADATDSLVGMVRGMVEPAGPAVFRLEQGLMEVAATARSLRHLVETVDRDPGIIIRGGNP